MVWVNEILRVVAGAFAVSKMMDSILSQQETYDLPSALGKKDRFAPLQTTPSLC